MAPQVVTVIPCYRERVDRIAATVASALAVSDRVIVVDDGGDMPAIDGVDVIRLPDNRGCSAALNAGIATCSDDDIVCRLDVGDVFYEDPKRRQINVVRGEFASCSSSPHFDPVAGETYRVPHDWQKRIYRDSVFTGCTNVYRVSVWREVGGHDESLRYLADWDFSMKVQHAIGWHMFPEPTCAAGMHPGGHSDRGAREKNGQRNRDHGTVAERGRMLSHPDLYRRRRR